MRRPEPRDLEILRTIARLRYVTTPELQRAFFSHDRVARRRMQILAEMGLVHLHTKGLPPRTQWGAWRITRRGLGRVLDHFPEEVLRDNLPERAAEGSLLDLHEHAPGNQLYLDLIAPRPPTHFVGSRVMFCRWWFHQVNRRASAICWRRMGSLWLRSSSTKVVPDATLVAPARKLRVFIYFDEPRARRSWAASLFSKHNEFVPYYGPADHLFGDGCAPYFLFLTRNVPRAHAIDRQLRSNPFQKMPGTVVMHHDAARWLGEWIFGAPQRAVG
jgi:hypothetical protein